MGAVWVGVLGELEVRGPDGERVEVGGPMVRTLLVRLAVDAGRIVTTDRLIADLWPESAPAEPGAALQSLVARLRRAIGRATIGSHPTGYRLEVPPVEVDLRQFERAIAEGRPREALELWRGCPLADVGDAEFARAPIARLEELRATAVEARIDADIAARRDVIAEVEELAAAQPLREGLHARLMRALTAKGRQADALAVYDRVRKLLAEQLGVDPGPELREAHLQALRTTSTRSNLPARLTSFVGRDLELEQVTRALAAARLVTLTGTGGAGKTRLAIEAAERLLTEFPDGVWLIDLAPTTDVAAAIREALNTADHPRDYLATRNSLLVLDNCEHVIDAAADFAAGLLARCPRLKILATSREPLSITGETLCPLRPLADNQAVTLFTDRARAVSPDFRPDESTVDICRALDGLPLAIELAAARTRSLTPAQLVERLGDRIGLLDKGTRAAPQRHRTLRAVIDWSWDLLDDAERTLLSRLSVFAGGATLEAIERVTDGTLDQLTSLVDKSLVVATEERYRLLETIREYAASKLDGDETRQRHTEYYTELVERAEPLLRGPEQATWLARLTAERANLDLAMSPRMFTARLWLWLLLAQLQDPLRWAETIDTDEARLLRAPTEEMLDRLALEDGPATLALVVVRSGDNTARLSGIAKRLGESVDPWRRAAGELLHGYVASEISDGRVATAEHHFTRAATAFRELGDQVGLSYALMFLSISLASRGENEAALKSVSEALALGVHMPTLLQVQSAQLQARTGDIAGARRLLERAERSAPEDDPVSLTRIRNALAELARLGGRLDEALEWHQAALAVDHPDAPNQFLAHARTNYALTLAALGDREEAGRQHEIAVELAMRTKDAPARALVLEAQADWYESGGDQEQAAALRARAAELRG
ncbi:BTAD domain-containing putative transcriptional regulator [Kutzneria kofuensis]|uniref:Putative ATPase/DNA-binding winged helix-turn-helix (WHTH) protein n=1 Tax=Kutzneria kofuensis TaxID=103725 RepID=A0A7W9KD60_9PSEU|nr:BTAD domain-containing putative transcriptional regulator [Kutzneria kofuensis]MBB5890381.1 putative ATPase/DNA-binding winged helix-turn-helix (wHTH) protein [Kutzneria kofuensis]